MRTVLRLLALLLLLGTSAWWVAAGKNPGWTKNKVAVEKKDEITEIVFTEYEDRFVPGVDILVAAGVGALAMAGLSFLGRRKAAAP